MKKLGILIFVVALVSSLTAVSAVTGNSLLPSLPKMFVRVKGSGNLQTERRDLPSFTAVKASGAANIEINVGDSQSVEVTTDDNLLEMTKTYVKNDTLYIERRGNIWTNTPLQIRINVPELKRLNLNGASRADVKNARADVFELDLNGASKVNLDGAAATFNVDMSGASDLNADNFKTAKTTVDVSGASRASVFATDELNADASGASKILYAGNPTTVHKDESGASRVAPR